jgi:hypothetical protein
VNNLVRVRSATFDPDLANNDAQTFMTVEAAADLALSKTASAPVVMAGEQVTYTISHKLRLSRICQRRNES